MALGCEGFTSFMNVQIKDCAWGSAAWSFWCLDLANLERVELDRVFVDEGTGYGVKALGSQGKCIILKVHD